MDIVVLVIGLGSMGKRRIRNLQAIGVTQIWGVDVRADRREEAKKTYKIKTSDNFDAVINQIGFNALVISLPPDIHHIYMKKAIDIGIPAFIEASVVDTDFELMIQKANERGVLLAPSCTLCFHPAIKKINDIVKNGELGTISNYLYHSGQYLPDWHTYEKVSEYYVSNKATGGAREIVPFELTWITKLLGFPDRVVGFYKKAIELEGADQIDDTYNMLLDYKGFIFNLSVDVVSRCATRRLTINGDKKQLYWCWDDNMIKLFDGVTNNWENIEYEIVSAQSGYNKNITEQMYIDEMTAFLNAIINGTNFPNSMIEDQRVLKILYDVEKSSDSNKIQNYL